MSRFVHIDYPTRHPGVARIERAARVYRSAGITTLVLRALAVIGSPVTRLVSLAGAGVHKWNETRRQAREDEKLWNIALTDARVMADLSRAMGAEALHDIKRYY